MSTTVRAERELTPGAGGPRRSTAAIELQTITAELDGGLREEQAHLGREVLLWQRWVRYLGIGTLVLLSLVFGGVSTGAILPLLLLVGAYAGVVMFTGRILQRDLSPTFGMLFPVLLVVADVVAVAGHTYLTNPPQELHRILLLGLLSQLGVYYFGRRHGAIVAALTLVAYVATAVFAPAFVAGPRVSTMTVVLNATLFVLVSALLIYTFGVFRARIEAIRLYCKVIERGDTVALPPLPSDRWPDGLTLLARSVQSMHARLAEQVGSDALTGCLNRRSLEMRLRADLRSARRRGSTVAVAAVDLDNFKEINDSRGHPVGDVVLQQVASIMKSTARDTDAVARFGGDEFVVVLPDTGWQGALTFADRLRRRVDDFSFGPPNTPPMGVTISVGVALGRGAESSTTEGLLQEADAALYRAKTAGRNRVFS